MMILYLITIDIYLEKTVNLPLNVGVQKFCESNQVKLSQILKRVWIIMRKFEFLFYCLANRTETTGWLVKKFFERMLDISNHQRRRN